MWIFGISRPIGGAVPNFGMGPKIMVLMKHTKLVSIDQRLAEIQPQNQLGWPR